MNPRKLVIAAVALVAMVTVAKYTGCMAWFQTPQGQKMNQPQSIINGMPDSVRQQILNTPEGPLQTGGTTVPTIQSLGERLNQMSTEEKTKFDNLLRQNGMKPETMTFQDRVFWLMVFTGQGELSVK